jgi:lysozyme
MAFLLKLGAIVMEANSESFTPKGEIAWDKPFSPQGEIVWDNPSPMEMLDEAIAREDASTDFTEEESNFLVEQEEMQQPAIKERVVAKLKDREGVVNKSYLDSLGKPTGGVGHLLTTEEQALYPEGTEIPQEVIDGWLVQDSTKAMEAAEKQAQELGVESEEMVLALSSVNFQLGPNWKKEHKNTWKLMKQGKYEEAAEEAANSDWHGQTPTRVEDFQEALRNEAEQQGYKKLKNGWYRDPDTGEKFEIVDGRRV